LSVRIPRTLAEDLKKAADQEANTPSAVARRLIATGLAREQRAAEHDDAAQTEPVNECV
jgi:hypothetical protein